MDIENLTLKQLKEINALFGAPNGLPRSENIQLARNGDLVIVILQRGHIAIGVYSQNGSIGRLENAGFIRQWGTTAGLGELAEKGPLTNTKIDKSPPLTFHVREVIATMEVAPNAWRNYGN